jgi:hypothetical protein
VWGGLQWVWGQVYSGLQWVWNQVWSGLQWVWTKITEGAQWVWAQVWSGLQWVWTQIYPYLKQAYDWILSGFTWIRTELWPALKTAFDELGAGLEKAWGNLTKFLGELWANFYKFVQETIVPAVMSAVETVRSSIDLALRGIGSFLLDGVAGIASGAPEDAVARAMGIGITVSALLATLYVGVEVVEFLYPTKNLSLIEMVRSVTGAFGVNYFGPVMMGLLIAGTLEPVMRQGINARYRHQMPSMSQADTMRFHGALSESDWSTVYDRAGWSDTYQAAWSKSYWTNPNARAIITMMDIPGPWIDKAPEWLQEEGFRKEDADILRQYGLTKSHQDDLKLLITQAENDFVATLSDEGELQANLAAAGLDPDEVKYHIAKAKSQARRSLLTDQIATTKEKFMDGTVDQGAATSELLTYGLKQPKVSVLVNRWVAQKTPKLVQASKAKKKNLTLAEVFSLYDRKRWSRTMVLERLKDMDYDPNDAEDLVWDHDQAVAAKKPAAG